MVLEVEAEVALPVEVQAEVALERHQGERGGGEDERGDLAWRGLGLGSGEALGMGLGLGL